MIRLLFLVLLLAGTLQGQTASTGVPLSGVLIDRSNASVPDARIVLRNGAFELSTMTSLSGEFRFENLAPGNYELLTTVFGFDPVRRSVRIGSRPPRPITIRLTLAGLKEELTVLSEERQLSAEAARNADAISVERTLLDNLPFLDNNYLGALARFLDSGLPGDAGTSLVVDGMEARNVGVPASAIQEIRINNNPYAVEYPRWSRRRIEVITKSSADRYHGTFNFSVS